MKVTYEGTDVLICDWLNREGKEIRSVIACTEKAEKKLYQFAIHTLNKTGVEIGTLRTVFGLTFYASCDRAKTLINDFIKEKEFKTYYGHI